MITGSKVRDWPKLPDGAIILYEYDNAIHPERLLIEPRNGGYRITFVSKLDPLGDAPPLSAETVIEIAKKMIATVSV